MPAPVQGRYNCRREAAPKDEQATSAGLEFHTALDVSSETSAGNKTRGWTACLLRFTSTATRDGHPWSRWTNPWTACPHNDKKGASTSLAAAVPGVFIYSNYPCRHDRHLSRCVCQVSYCPSQTLTENQVPPNLPASLPSTSLFHYITVSHPNKV